MNLIASLLMGIYVLLELFVSKGNYILLFVVLHYLLGE